MGRVSTIVAAIAVLIGINSCTNQRSPTIPNKKFHSAVFPKNFLFGVSNAPSQVEDKLDDIWSDWAKNKKIGNFYNYARPFDRILFWSNPQVELDLAKELGVQVFRLGVSWQRIFPNGPSKPDLKALNHYKKILSMIKKRGMKVMLTIFHHSEPKWSMNRGGWLNSNAIDDFIRLTTTVADHLGEDVDYWITFNEANLYTLLTQIKAIWPHTGSGKGGLQFFSLGPIKGKYERALENMAKAHKRARDYIKSKFPRAPLGIANFTGVQVGSNWTNRWVMKFLSNRNNTLFMDMIVDDVDFLGINYYGIEVASGFNLTYSPKYEYSDSGRAIYPIGLYRTIKEFHQRYNIERKNRSKNNTAVLPFFITENGIADANDWLRPSYMIEHLITLNKVMSEGIEVLGYIAWTLSDNFEWTDGYCAQFGLVSVDRKNNMKRTKRNSFYVYQNIIKQNAISAKLRDTEWAKLMSHSGKQRSICHSNTSGVPIDIPKKVTAGKVNNWRFH